MPRKKELKDMTIDYLAKHPLEETASPRTDIITVKELKEWAKAKADMLREQIDSCGEHDPYCDDCDTAWDIMDWLKENFNLKMEDSDGSKSGG